MGLVNRFSKEEKQDDMNDTLEMLKQGIAQAEIARQLGRSTQYISNIKIDLINNGLISQDEINVAREKNFKRKNSKNDNANQKEAIKQEKKQKILDGLNAGKTAIELMKEFEIPSTTMHRYIKELIQEGKIDEKNIVKQKNKNKDEAIERNNLILADYKTGNFTRQELAKKYNVSETLIIVIIKDKYDEHIAFSPKKKRKPIKLNTNVSLTGEEALIFDYISKGFQYTYIAKQLEMSQKELLKIINVLKVKGAVNSEYIQEMRDKKRTKDEIEVLNYLKMGYKQADILRIKKEFNNPYLSRMVSKLKDENKISDEEISLAQAEDEDAVYLREHVLRYMKRGFTVKQIIEADDTRVCY